MVLSWWIYLIRPRLQDWRSQANILHRIYSFDWITLAAFEAISVLDERLFRPEMSTDFAFSTPKSYSAFSFRPVEREKVKRKRRRRRRTEESFRYRVGEIYVRFIIRLKSWGRKHFHSFASLSLFHVDLSVIPKFDGGIGVTRALAGNIYFQFKLYHCIFTMCTVCTLFARLMHIYCFCCHWKKTSIRIGIK